MYFVEGGGPADAWMARRGSIHVGLGVVAIVASDKLYHPGCGSAKGAECVLLALATLLVVSFPRGLYSLQLARVQLACGCF